MHDGKFFVIGGEYADTHFTQIAAGHEEERHGPYSENEARDAWRALTSKTVDNALVRYRIRPDHEVLGEVWFVVGGEYADTDFRNLAAGVDLESYGPYPRPEARAVWQALTGKTVDNAMIRYNIVTAEALEAMRQSS
jgi:hypothetical protein